VPDLAVPLSLQLRPVADRKISGSTKGKRTFALNTEDCRRNRLARRFDLRLARISGLS